MISSIRIEGYRGFTDFEMEGLGRINLLVGSNNSGKTSVLEALYLLTSRGDPMSLWQVVWRRGERLPAVSQKTHQNPEIDVSHLFTGHEAHIGSKFTLSAKNQSPGRNLSVAIAETTLKERVLTMGAGEDSPLPTRLVLQVKGNPSPPSPAIPLSRSFGISPEVLENAPFRRSRKRVSTEEPSQFITVESLDGDDLISLWDKVALTPNEEVVLRALRFLDPDIERIAAQAAQPYYLQRGGFIIKQRGNEHPIPIGSMGDGMWRMLAMAIAITQCKGGVLLVDEIDTGLHYSVMAEMWKLIFNAAKELNVQVFATTHSSDCVYGLAHVSETDPNHLVTVQRIDSGKRKSVAYSDTEIRIAAEREIEVR